MGLGGAPPSRAHTPGNISSTTLHERPGSAAGWFRAASRLGVGRTPSAGVDAPAEKATIRVAAASPPAPVGPAPVRRNPDPAEAVPGPETVHPDRLRRRGGGDTGHRRAVQTAPGPP